MTNQLNMEDMYEPLHPNEIKRGIYIVIVKVKKNKVKNTMFGPVEVDWEFDGEPLEVLSVALPFIAVTNGGDRFSLDLRECDVLQVNRQYVEARRDPRHFSGKKAVTGKKQRKEKKDSNGCPRCGTRMIQRIREKQNVWTIVCPTCGYEPPFAKPGDVK